MELCTDLIEIDDDHYTGVYQGNNCHIKKSAQECKALTDLSKTNSLTGRISKLLMVSGDYVVIETIEGCTLHDAELSLQEKLSVVKHLLEIMNDVHKAGWIHGDLRDDNVIITSDNRVVLIDFGSAIEIGSICVDGLLFPPPESLDTDRLIATQQLDYWYLGKLIYSMFLPGYSPGISQFMLNEYSPNEIKAFYYKYTPQVDAPAEINEILSKLLQIDPSKRVL